MPKPTPEQSTPEQPEKKLEEFGIEELKVRINFDIPTGELPAEYATIEKQEKTLKVEKELFLKRIIKPFEDIVENAKQGIVPEKEIEITPKMIENLPVVEELLKKWQACYRICNPEGENLPKEEQFPKGNHDAGWVDDREKGQFDAYYLQEDWVSAKRIVESGVYGKESKSYKGRKVRLLEVIEEVTGKIVAYDDIEKFVEESKK